MVIAHVLTHILPANARMSTHKISHE